MIVILIIVGLFTFEFILPGLWSDFFKKDSKASTFRDPGLAEKFYEHAFKSQTNLRWKDAIENYTKAISFDTKQPIYYNNRGMCYHFLEDYKRAIIDFTAAISIDDKNVTFYENRGLAYINLCKNYSALNDWRKAVTLGSKDSVEFINQYEKDTKNKSFEKFGNQDDLPF